MPHGLYIHVPFCVRKCIYCDFYSEEVSNLPLAQRLKAPPPDQSLFLDALEIELGTLPEHFRPDTIFIGGGTPTELSDDNFERLLTMILHSIDGSSMKEWTCESNPGTLTQRKIDLIAESSITRVSLGVQSLNDTRLEFLGRIHSADEARSAYTSLRMSDCHINLDFIYAIPGQSLEEVDHDLQEILLMNPHHVSFYCLMYEEGTPLTLLKDRGSVKAASNDVARTLFEHITTTLAGAGYEQYELSNFAKPGASCLHNQLYWRGDDYMGCGPSAHSHWGGSRFSNVARVDRYCDAMLSGCTAGDFHETLGPEKKARETLILGLRMLDGWDHEQFQSKTGYSLRSLCEPAVESLAEAGLVEFNGNGLKLTPKGFFVSDTVFAELV